MSEPAERLNLLQFEEPDGEVRIGVELPIAPFGMATIVAEDDSADSQALLQTLSESWTILWPAMRELLCEGMVNLDVEIQPGNDDCMAYVSRCRPGKFMADKSDIYLSLEFEGESPDWDYFIKDAKIVHFQPVF